MFTVPVNETWGGKFPCEQWWSISIQRCKSTFSEVPTLILCMLFFSSFEPYGQHCKYCWTFDKATLLNWIIMHCYGVLVQFLRECATWLFLLAVCCTDIQHSSWADIWYPNPKRIRSRHIGLGMASHADWRRCLRTGVMNEMDPE